jgi:hypothetical protein
MNIKSLATAALLVASAPCFAYNCSDSEAYKTGVASVTEANRRNGAQLGVAVHFLQKKESVGFDEALKEVMQHGDTPAVKTKDDQLAELATKIKLMKPESADECTALLQLQQQYSAIGTQKIALVVKDVTGQDPSIDK